MEIVNPLKFTDSLVASTKNTRFEPPPLIVRREAPGPSMVRLLVIIGNGVARLIVPVTEKLIVSVAADPRIAARKDPAPESFVVVTVMAAGAEVHRRASNNQAIGSLKKTRAFMVKPGNLSFKNSSHTH